MHVQSPDRRAESLSWDVIHRLLESDHLLPARLSFVSLESRDAR
jgi:hypothetical protein